MSLLGLDIGTTGCKAMVFAADGRVLGQARRESIRILPWPWRRQCNGGGALSLTPLQ